MPDDSRVLIVDDDADSAKMLSLVLQVHGFDTRVATSGDMALGIFDVWLPGTIVLDLAMPRMNGLQVCRELREYHAAADVLIVMVSGYTREEDRVAAIEAGANYYLIKPVDPEQLVEVIRQYSEEA